MQCYIYIYRQHLFKSSSMFFFSFLYLNGLKALIPAALLSNLSLLQSNLSMHTAGVSYLQHHHHHHHHQQQQQQQQPPHPLPSSQAPNHPLPAAQPSQQPISSQVPASHSNSVVQVYSTLPHMSAGGVGGGSEIHTLGLQPFHSVQVSKDH